jgi:hypothetical protein
VIAASPADAQSVRLGEDFVEVVATGAAPAVESFTVSNPTDDTHSFTLLTGGGVTVDQPELTLGPGESTTVTATHADGILYKEGSVLAHGFVAALNSTTQEFHAAGVCVRSASVLNLLSGPTVSLVASYPGATASAELVLRNDSPNECAYAVGIAPEPRAGAPVREAPSEEAYEEAVRAGFCVGSAASASRVPGSHVQYGMLQPGAYLRIPTTFTSEVAGSFACSVVVKEGPVRRDSKGRQIPPAEDVVAIQIVRVRCLKVIGGVGCWIWTGLRQVHHRV